MRSQCAGLPFDMQIAQSFHVRNEDCHWRHGAVETTQEDGLRQPDGGVAHEDIRRMQNRFEAFQVAIPPTQLQDMAPCAIHLARWLQTGTHV